MPTPVPRSRQPHAKSVHTHASKAKKQGGSVKQPLSIAERVKRLFASLCSQIDGGHFSNAIKTCDKILRLEPSDVDAIQIKLFLLLQTEQYEPALALAEESGHDFEKVYSLYRLHKETEAVNMLRVLADKANGIEDRGVLHLEAQLSYRQGAYEAAFDIYNRLLNDTDPQTEEYSDILTNLQASQKQLDFLNKDFLRALDNLPSHVTASLESAPPPAQPSSSVVATLASSAGTAGPTVADPPKSAKKVRLSRVPKSVVLGVTPPPDPERWLKKSERSTYGQSYRRRRGWAGATQGSTAENMPAGSTAGQHKSSGGNRGKKKK